ncbi:MAG: TIM barrel protein [Acidiferrobacterales bacterium]|nr:TIM barrel protein [Acidiferrobacterales bacterium]
MVQFSANLGFLWQELSLPERILAAKKAGFSAVECHFPYDSDPNEVSAALRETGLVMLALNTHPGEISDGEFGLCAVPGEEDRARAAIDQALDYAMKISASRVHVMAGLHQDAACANACFLQNLTYACKRAAENQISILIEPINQIDKPGYVLHRTAQGIAIIEALRLKHQITNIGLMFDCYHVQMTEGNILGQLSNALPYVDHIQIAAVPGRGEPDSGEINYPWLLDAIDKLGYQGFIGAEYIPASTTDEGLSWLAGYQTTP